MKSKYIIIQIILSTFLGVGFLLLNSGRWIDHWVTKQSIPTASEHLIGNVQEASGDVRRRMSGQLGWTPLMKGDLVYKKDAVFTGPGAETKLTLTEDVQIELGPESMVQLQKVRGKNSIHLTKGDLAVHSGQTQTLDIVRGDNSLETLTINSESQKLSARPPSKSESAQNSAFESKNASQEVVQPQGLLDVNFKGHRPQEKPLKKNQYEEPYDSELVFILIYVMASGIALLGLYESKKS